MTYFNRFKDVDIALQPISHPMDGEFKLVAFKGYEFPKGSGKIWRYPNTSRVLQDWNSNIITNLGLNDIGGPTGGGYILADFHVGGGTTTPTVNDVSMAAEIATVGIGGTVISYAQTSPPYWGRCQVQGLFSPGFGGGAVNINEIGISKDGGPNSVGARALTVDGNGDPTTVSVAADEYLEVYYRRRNYPAHINADGSPTDDTAVVNIEGTNYTYTIRPIYVTSAGNTLSGSNQGWGSGQIYTQTTSLGFVEDAFAYAMAKKSDATLGAVTSGLGGTDTANESSTGHGTGQYTADTFSRELYYVWGISNANDAGGIGGITIKSRYGAYQLVFNNPIPKVYGQVFTFYHNFSWARKTI